ncbi:hypothetical protein C3747_18g317 [Trypanosoma cruzi]|uniref:Uncharacterized protein n=2 Tax=Trypanosoma cruzi TaxID=5693 RepID=Q4DS99_TRYCC|nr:hypothetical protein, conserved [Trypanosoma cruzi]EAN95404.1 hypothetical protein, conserved [Trypanosoma cruzi]PWV17395.1 hypothetical protein C3747_18g317 [Trypanosoma cruzi]|eukprot:XP_817255.1 hypothetical protein [Trypanosoma cruzi strain CL Brener]
MLSPTTATSGYLVPHSAFNSTFENVMFPVRTLYCPPVPPSMLMGRYKPPPRPGRKYRNDLSLAGPRDHWAQTQVARIWRGVLTRRRLRNERNHFEVRTRRAIMIQCWWRRLRAIWRRRFLRGLVDEWIVSRRESMLAERLRGYGVMLSWQRRRFENAVIKLQRVFRWYLSQRTNVFADATQPPREKLPFPLRIQKKVYFPWRRREEAKDGSIKAASSNPGQQKKERSTSIQFRKYRREPQPTSVEEAKVINDAMREREARNAVILSQPEVQDRMQWKRDGLLLNDFDHNAGMIQRFVRGKWNVWEKVTRKVTSDYFNDKVCIIQRSFRVFKTLRHITRVQISVENRAVRRNQAYAKEKLARMEEEIAWQYNLLNNAARTIQMLWAYYKHKSRQTDPFREAEGTAAAAAQPPPPPYNLILEHIARERALRIAARSKMEAAMEEARKRARRIYKRYVPESIEVVSGEGMLFSTARDKTEQNEGRIIFGPGVM